MRIIQISDTHLSATHDHFAANTKLIASALAEYRPDLFIHTGDVSMDGAGQPHELELAKAWNDNLTAEVLALPGNHDVGDLPSLRPDQPVTESRLKAWNAVFDTDRWFRDINGWRLIGINAMLFATGLPQEDEQLDWLTSAVDVTKPIALFSHKPLCIGDLSEGPRGYWTIAPEPRARLRKALEGKPVRMVASGHLHIQRHATIDGVDHVWAPAASFVVGASQENLGGERRLGFVEHVFGKESVTSRFIRPDGLRELELDAVRSEIYPD